MAQLLCYILQATQSSVIASDFQFRFMLRVQGRTQDLGRKGGGALCQDLWTALKTSSLPATGKEKRNDISFHSCINWIPRSGHALRHCKETSGCWDLKEWPVVGCQRRGLAVR